MHITLWLTGDGGRIRVPRSNLHLFQSMLYAVLPPERAAFLHDEGYPVDGRRMKLFAMSWPIAAERPVFEDGAILFPLPLRLVVSTPVTDTMDGIAGGALNAGDLRLGNNVVRCERIEAEQQRADGEALTVRTLSPITHKLAAATVITDSAMQADGLSTLLMVLGPEQGYNYAVRHQLAALLVSRTPSGFATRTTPAFEQRFPVSSNQRLDGE